MNSKLLIFDLDGTLVDSRADLSAGINYMRGQFELEPLSMETITGFIGDGALKLVERSLSGVDTDLKNALSVFRGYYMQHSTEKTSLYDGVEEGVKQLVERGAVSWHY